MNLRSRLLLTPFIVYLSFGTLLISSNAYSDNQTKHVTAGKILSQKATATGLNQIPQAPVSEALATEIFAPIQQLFDGMREHNKDKIVAAFASDASIVRASHSGVLKNTVVHQFAQSIAKRKRDIMDERIINYRIQQFENLANVWTYFVFYFNGKISHCGVNSVQVVLIDKEWKIGHLMDTPYTGLCESFIAEHSL